ncbi:MAG TPA: segregation/condensation protein A [Candidatus Saccharimonadia bacterium]
MTRLPVTSPESNIPPPLELLYESVKRGAVELSTVSLAEITSRYLAKLAELHEPDPQKLAVFVELGARLIFLKSQALLPADLSEAPAGLDELNLELHNYLQVQAQADALRQLQGQTSWPRPHQPTRRQPRGPVTLATPATPADQPLDHQLTALTAAWAALQSRQPQRLDGAVTPPLSLTDAMAHIQHQLTAGRASLAALLTSQQPRHEVIVRFLAVLELLKRGEIILAQPVTGPVLSWHVEWARG